MTTAIICIVFVIWIVFAVRSYKKKLTQGCCGSSSQPQIKKIKVKDRDISHYPYHKRLKIDGMVCGNCAVRVENALNQLEGVWARVDLPEESAEIYMKQPVSDEMLKDTVKKAGYLVYKIME